MSIRRNQPHASNLFAVNPPQTLAVDRNRLLSTSQLLLRLACQRSLKGYYIKLGEDLVQRRDGWGLGMSEAKGFHHFGLL